MVQDKLKKSFSILGMGTVVVDHQVVVRELPEPDAKAEILSDRFQVGGPVPTALALLTRFGASTSFIGKWSTDRWGEMIENDLGQARVDIGQAVVSPAMKTGFAHVWVEAGTGRRSIAVYRGSLPLESADLEGIAWPSYHALHLDAWPSDTAIEAARHMKASGGRVFIDFGSPKPDWETLIGLADYVNCPRRLVDVLFPGTPMEEAAKRLVALGASEVTVTDGDSGAWFFDANTALHQPAIPVDAVDTNGAGDVFTGAMIFLTMQNRPPEERLRFATAAAALKCQQLGNRDALPSLEKIESLLGDRDSD